MTLHDISSQYQRRLRSFRLASDARTGTYARSTARGKQFAQFRRRWVAHVLSTVLSCAVVWLLSLTLPLPYLQGLTVGVGCTAAVAAQWMWIVQATGTAYLAMGERAEQFTAALLRKRRGWRLVNHVNLRQSDIDHVLLGPDGIFAVETKWSSRTWSAERLAEVAKNAAGNARDLTLWAPLRTYGPVRPIVVLWGPAADDLPVLTTIGGVDVIPGQHFEQWWQQRPLRQPALTVADLDSAWDALSNRCAVMDPNQPVKPLAISDMAIMGSIAVSVGIFGFVAVAWTVTHLPLATAIGAVAIAAAVGLLLRHRLHEPVRWLTTAWVAGIASACAFGVVALVFA